MSDEERWELALPDGARVVSLAEQLLPAAPEGALGATPAPGGAEIYGGSDLHAYMSADGTLFVIYCGERGPGYKFGTYCLRYWRDGRREWVELGAFTEGRAGVVREPDGLYLAWPLPGGKSWERVKVPGYVTPGWPSSGQSVVAPVSITTTPAPAQFAGADQAARDQLAALKKQLAALTNRVAQLEARPAGAQGPDVNQIRDVIWNLPTVVDRIYAELAADNKGLVEQVERIVRRVLARGASQG
ncbi:MAG TPA: hypothetical protein PKD53_15710 [Chloroflexaceae bacterium]|nr:hypothetical protein [Chloroflexaceae bacterium]